MDNLHIQEKKTWPFWKYFAVLYGVLVVLFLISVLLAYFLSANFFNLEDDSVYVLILSLIGGIAGLFFMYGAPLLIIIFSAVYLSKNEGEYVKSLLLPLSYGILILIEIIISLTMVSFVGRGGDYGGLGIFLFLIFIRLIATIALSAVVNFIIYRKQKNKIGIESIN